MNLAERCFAHDNNPVHDELFETIHAILGGRDTRGCSHPDFKFAVVDTYTDPYDASVEVILPEDAPPITREQADKILALGFDGLYESQGERGFLWGKTLGGACSPRQPREDARCKDQQIKELKAELAIAKAFRDIGRGWKHETS